MQKVAWESLMLRCTKWLLAIGLVWTAAMAHGAVIDLASILGNPSYEADLVHSQWKVTRPNGSYDTVVPVNPAFSPLNPAFNDGTTQAAPTAPVGTNYIAVLNPTEEGDIKGKLAHDSLAAVYTLADSFQVKVWGNRGRLGTNGNTNSTFAGLNPTALPTLKVQFLTWGPGSVPTVDVNDNWSRGPSFSSTVDFTSWAGPTAWASQVFSFSPGLNISYLALAVSGQNNNHDQYVAWDIGQVPEPSSLALAALGGVSLAVAYLRRRTAKRV
jgi:hypothetical protein